MQGVFIRTVVDVDGLEELIQKQPGLAHMSEEGDLGSMKFQPILSAAQRRERRDQAVERLMILGDRLRREPSIEAESLIGAAREQQGAPLVVFVRPATKKALREAVKADPRSVYLQETSHFENEYEGWLSDAPEGRYEVVGPEPARSRDWFAAIRWSEARDGWLVE
jgi:hypothetical protein